MMIVIQQSELVNQTSKVSKTTHWSVEKYRMKEQKNVFSQESQFFAGHQKRSRDIFFSRPPYNVKIEEMSNCHQWNVNALLNDSTSPYLIIPNPFPIFLRVKQFSCQL